MSCKMNLNDMEKCSQFSHELSNAQSDRQNENTVNSCKMLRCPESLVCCPDLQTAQLDDSDSAYRVVNINLKECATKLWNNLFGNFSIESATYFDDDRKKNYSVSNVCDVPGCNYNGDKMMRKKTMLRSRSETSKYDHQKPNWQNVDVTKVNRMRGALKCCLLEKISRPKICDSFLMELQQVLARYPYTDLHYYWKLIRAIQAEIEEHKCIKVSASEHGDKKLKQLYMLSYAITRLILQLDFITSGRPTFGFKRSKSWGQVLHQFKEEFRDPATGQFSINPFPKIASSLKASFQDGANEQNSCNCLPPGLFSRAIDTVGSEGENSHLTLKADSFPGDFTCFDVESLTYLLDSLNCDLQREYSKGITGKCQVTNCPFPVPVRDGRVIKDLRSNIHAIEQLIFYLQRMNSFTAKISPMRNCDKVWEEDKPIMSNIKSKSILKNRSNFVDNQMKVEVVAFQAQCPACPELNARTMSRCYSPMPIKKNTQNCVKNDKDCGFPPTNSFNLCVTKVVPPKINDHQKVVDLCSAEPTEIKNLSSRKRSQEKRTRRSRSGASRSLVCCSKRDLCKKYSKVDASCHQCEEKKEGKRKKRKDSNSDRECDFSFRVKRKESCEEKGNKKNSDKCETNNSETASDCKSKNEDNVLIMCCNADCESKGGVISSVTKLVKKIDPKIPPLMCDPCNTMADKYKTQKCIEKLRKSSKSNVQINDCRHKKEQIIRLVNLLSNNDCSFKPTMRSTSNNSFKNGLEEVCELYDKFLALEVNEGIGKKEGCQQEEPSCVEKLKMAFARGKSAQNTTECNNINQKASIGVQASTDCKWSSCDGRPSKQSIGTSALFDPNFDSNWAHPSNTIDTSTCKKADSSSILSKRFCRTVSNDDLKQNSTTSLKDDSKLNSRTSFKNNLKKNPSGTVISLKMNTSETYKLGNTKSIECLRKKLESRLKALSKQQQKIHEKQRKAAEKRRLKDQQEQRKVKCVKCRVSKVGKLNPNQKDSEPKNRVRNCKLKTKFESSKSKCSLKSCKSKNNVQNSKSALSLRGCKSKCCKMKDHKRAKSCSTKVFAIKTDPCFSLDMPDNVTKTCKSIQKCSSSICKGKKKPKPSVRKSNLKFKKSNCKFKKSDWKLEERKANPKECKSSLKKTSVELKKSCSALKKCDAKLKKYELQIKKCQSRLSQCDETKKKLEKCTSVLLKKLSQHQSNNN